MATKRVVGKTPRPPKTAAMKTISAHLKTLQKLRKPK